MKHLLLVALILSGTIPSVFAAQLDANMSVDADTVLPKFSFLRIIYIEYPEGGEIAQILRGEQRNISFEAGSDSPGTKQLINQINENLKILPSTAFVTDVKVNYQAILSGNQDSAVIEVKLELVPTLVNSVIKSQGDSRTIDANWRGITLDSPILFETQYGTLDINNPKDTLNLMIPGVMNKFENSNVGILELPLANSSGILEYPIYKWHSLFDNTAIIQSKDLYNFTGKYVVTYYSMGECNIFDGFCNDRKWIQKLELDENYQIVMVESRDDASIAIEGYVEISSLDSIETFEASLHNPIDKVTAPEFPSAILYGMAGMAAIGGVVMFIFSSRKLKKDENQGQTGVDPGHLQAYETSDSAGGYKTNRGEAILANNQESKMPV